MTDTRMRDAPDDPVATVAAAFPVTDRKGWIAVIGIALLVAGGFLWLALGQAPQTVRGSGIVLPMRGFVDIGRDVEGTLSELLVAPGDAVSRGDVVARLSAPTGTVDVTAPTDGVIATILERIGGTTAPGQPLIAMSSTTDAEVVVAFVPAQNGNVIKPGMSALVSVATYPASQYGTITGTVVSVPSLPVTEERIDLLVGGNDSLVRYFAEAGPVVEVTIRLDPDPSSVTGYHWTIGTGPNEPLRVGTLAEATVIVADGTPLSRILK